jgi:hypothetical protein
MICPKCGYEEADYIQYNTFVKRIEIHCKKCKTITIYEPQP